VDQVALFQIQDGGHEIGGRLISEGMVALWW